MAETQHGEVCRAITIDARVFGIGTTILLALAPFTTFAL